MVTRKTGRVRVNPVPLINKEMHNMVRQLGDLGLPKIGPGLKGLDGDTLHGAVVVSRLCSKFLPPVDGVEKSLHVEAILKMVQHDERGFDFAPHKVDAAVRPNIYQARTWLHDLFDGFKPSYNFRAPTGESALSNMGLTDVMYKLDDVSHWEVSRGALPFATAICYNNLQLKRLVRWHFRSLEPTGRPYKMQCKEWYQSGKTPYQCFALMFASLCTINEVNRVTSIPKNASSRRVITMVPFWNMVCQLSLMTDIRRVLKRRLGINLDTLQEIHKGLIANPGRSTIDLSRASDSVWRAPYAHFFPSSIRKWCDRLVDRHYEYDVSGKTEYGYFNMFAPMGCGLTFDVMTCMLLALGRTFDPGATVFGDDIIIRDDVAPLMVRAVEAIGMTVNLDKSFLSGPFRESCGGFYSDYTGHILCYDLLWAENRVEAFTNVNKLFELLRDHRIPLAIRTIIRATHDRILSDLRRFAVPETELPAGFPLQGSFLLVDYHTRPKRSAVGILYSESLHRLVHECTSVRVDRDECNPDENRVSTITCFFLRGESYCPKGRNEKEVFERVDSFTGLPLARAPIVTVL